MVTVEQLLEQALFLLGQHQEAYAESSKEFTGLLEFIREKSHEEADEDSAGILETLYEALKKQSQELEKNMSEDIDFLKDQIKAFTEVLEVKDVARKAELTALLIEDAGELQSTEEFKKEVFAESQLSRKGLSDMIADIRQTVEEGGAAELEMLFEAINTESSDSEHCCEDEDCLDATDLENSSCKYEQEEDELDEEEEGAEEEEGKGINIFESLEVAKSPKKSTQDKKDFCCGGDSACSNDCLCQ